jgi:hypothetical protein
MSKLAARERLAKIAYNLHKDERPALAGAYLIGEEQMICTGYVGVIYNDYEIVTKVENTENLIDLHRIFTPEFRDLSKKVRVDFKPSKTYDAYTAHRKENKERKGYIDLGGTIVDFQIFMPVYETLEKPKVYVNKGTEYLDKLSMVYLIGENGYAGVCPIKPDHIGTDDLGAVMIKFERVEE